MSFSNENEPLPIYTNPITYKEISNIQFYRSNTNSTGYQLTVNSSTNQLLPINAFNVLQSETGITTFKNGNTVVIGKKSVYLHNIIIDVYSTTPKTGMVAVDIINQSNNSLQENAFDTKGIANYIANPLHLNFTANHNIGDELRLRFGGGLVPGGADIELNILNISWIITEQ